MPENEVGKLQEQTNELSNRVSKLEAAQPYLEKLLDKNAESYEKLATTMEDVRNVMVGLSDKIDTQADSIEQMRNDIDKVANTTAKEIRTVKQNLDCLEDKGKFDIRKWIKEKFPWIVVLIGLGVFIVSQFIKF